MASLLRRFAPLIVGFVIKKIMNKRGGGNGKAGGYQQPGRRR